MHNVVTPQHFESARRFRQYYSRYQKARDLIQLGAYAAGSDPETDKAIVLFPHMQKFLMQGMQEQAPFDASVSQLSDTLGDDTQDPRARKAGRARG